MDARPEHATDELIVPDTGGVGTNWTLPKDRRVITGGNQLAIVRCPLLAELGFLSRLLHRAESGSRNAHRFLGRQWMLPRAR
jgi:hypothetical protein